MKPEIKKIWLKALRSGNYKQGYRRLNWHRRHCCLGVLCDLYSKAAGTPWTTEPLQEAKFMHGAIDYLPEQVMNWSGMTSADGDYGVRSLIEDNDKGKSFIEIANIIEKHF